MYDHVFSIIGAIGMCKIVHDKHGHIGQSKLWDRMRAYLFIPFLINLVKKRSIREHNESISFEVNYE